MPNETIERIRSAEKDCALRIQQAAADADEAIRQAESDNVLKLQKAMKSNQTFLREAAADAEMQAEIIRCTAEKEAAKEAAVLENDAADKLSAAISLVLAKITHRTDNGTR